LDQIQSGVKGLPLNTACDELAQDDMEWSIKSYVFDRPRLARWVRLSLEERSRVLPPVCSLLRLLLEKGFGG